MSGLVKKVLGFVCLGAIIVGTILIVTDSSKRDYLGLGEPAHIPALCAPAPPTVPPPPPPPPTARYGADDFLWLVSVNQADLLANRVAPPRGFARVPLEQGSFGDWLRHLPLFPNRPMVKLHSGALKANQDAHEAVIDLDTGSADLQQCADCVIRLRAEYLFSRGRATDIHFNSSSGEKLDWTRWSAGERPTLRGQRFTWRRTRPADSSHGTLRDYMEFVFRYAGTKSLARELAAVPEREVMPGDLFIRPGSPGHAVLVVDVATDRAGRRLMMLAQGFMPAQDMHLLRNLAQPPLGPWFDANFPDTLRTPEYTFSKGELRRFAN